MNITSFNTQENLSSNEFVLRNDIVYFLPRSEIVDETDKQDLIEIVQKINTISPRQLKTTYDELKGMESSIKELLNRCRRFRIPPPELFCLPFFGFIHGYNDYIPKAKIDWEPEVEELTKDRKRTIIEGACSIGLGYCKCVSDVLRNSWEDQIVDASLQHKNDGSIRLLCIGPGNFLDVHLLLSKLKKSRLISIRIDFYDTSFKKNHCISLLKFWKKREKNQVREGKKPFLVRTNKRLSLCSLNDCKQRYDVGFAMDFEPMETVYNKRQQAIREECLTMLQSAQNICDSPLLVFTKESEYPIDLSDVT